MQDKIVIQGAKEHNLKNINLEIPRNKLIVITGLSGSGKSSLAFDTIYAEGQRRYIESLSSYARQFLGQRQKSNVEHISGLSPAVAIQQKGPGHNPRSTVGTLTEIYDYLRLLFAHIGVPYCYQCGRPVKSQTIQEITDRILEIPVGSKIQLVAPLVRGRKGEFKDEFGQLRKDGFLRVRVDGKIYTLDKPPKLNKYQKHNIEVIVDRLIIKPEVSPRLADSLETCLKLSRGLVLVVPSPYSSPHRGEGRVRGGERFYSTRFACPYCGISFEDVTPQMFSFNSPYGACKECNGLGVKIEVDPALVVPDKSLSICEGAIVPWSGEVITTRRHRWKHAARNHYVNLLSEVAAEHGFSLDTPFNRLSKEVQNIVLYGSDEIDFEGVINNLQRRYTQTESDYVREEIYQRYMSMKPCPVCKGARLQRESLSVRVDGKNIFEAAQLPVTEAIEFFKNLSLTGHQKLIVRELLKEIKQRLQFLLDVGVGYLTLDRRATTLSAGETQRINLATQIGSGLMGVLYILDEPSIGLHQRDILRLLNTLKTLRNLGNTVIVVEHDEQTIRQADWIIDLGPGAGEKGGRVVFTGSPRRIEHCPQSVTGQYLNGDLKIPVPPKRRNSDKFLEIKGAREHNLKNINVKIPLGLFSCITGVSGSGKSTLIQETLYRALMRHFYNSKELPGQHDKILGLEHIDKVISIDQSPIGRTPRSNPATYTNTFTPIRELFARVPEARLRGYKPGRFSFNVKGGRCEACQGDGLLRIEMQFLPDVYVPCEVCRGKRYNRETLQIRYKGENIAEVLEMSVDEALAFFKPIPLLKRHLQTLQDVGLGYIKLGQSATTLSGGEAQRVKLATELAKKSTGRTLYLLDEPTTGLHFADIQKLLAALHRLVEAHHTVVVIEHNLEVIKTADWIIDLGPEGGDEGGRIVAAGHPETVANSQNSYTGRFLRKFLTTRLA